MNSHKTAKFVKVFSLESFPLYGIQNHCISLWMYDHHLKNVVHIHYTHIPKLCHGYSQVTREAGRVQRTRSLSVALREVQSYFPYFHTLPDGKRHFTRLYSLLQLTNVIAGFSLTLLFLMVSADS